MSIEINEDFDIPQRIAKLSENKDFVFGLTTTANTHEYEEILDSYSEEVLDKFIRTIENMRTTPDLVKFQNEIDETIKILEMYKIVNILTPKAMKLLLASLSFVLAQKIEEREKYAKLAFKNLILNITTNPLVWKFDSYKILLVEWSADFSDFITKEDFDKIRDYIIKRLEL